ncbi:hypothetical protein MMC14_003754 [Varicellaria rhodocarpa]|nr:hypothetical protein [Varicellaria rhodocarpa]
MTTDNSSLEISYLHAWLGILPTNRPVGFPHLLDIQTYEEADKLPMDPEKFRLADAVATVIFKHSPETLRQFLDLNVPEVAWFLAEPAKGKYEDYFERKGSTVMYGCFWNDTSSPSGAVTRVFDDKIIYRIVPSGEWVPLAAWHAADTTASADGFTFEAEVVERWGTQHARDVLWYDLYRDSGDSSDTEMADREEEGEDGEEEKEEERMERKRRDRYDGMPPPSLPWKEGV